MQWVWAAGVLLCANLGLAQEASVDFEAVPPQLPGWSATITGAGSPSEYRPAAKWDVPFTISLDGEKPHDGASALKWAFSADVPGMASLMPPAMTVSGPAARIRLFVRCEGLSEEPFLSFEETSAEGQRVKPHWMAVKIPLGEDWTEVTWSGPLQPATGSLRLSIICKSPAAGASVWIDDIRVEPAEAE